ncbi:hypothetical protein [Mesoterricola silvestris]|uniref:Uncharacterized protein n=1 Tax=Mesoterricola silvestris TaxID=2927979 RepID=A0AA48GY84_9BACT|nr:hypothetical protein [Mesoterricola silvestris]BDU74071.1 hypothetical protein METEAL_32450 [Mesoterricola silvestris]
MAEPERPNPPDHPEASLRLMGDFLQEVQTPLQYLGLNLSFLQHGCHRLARVLEAHHGAMGAYPPEVAERLRRVEEELDLPFLQDELPKVLAESMEGLATVTRIVAAMHAVNPGKGE